MKTLFILFSLLPSLALAHGKHPEASSDAAHGLLHAMASLEGVVTIAALAIVVYFLFFKK